MGFKGIYKDKSSATKIGILFLLIFVSVILHTLVGSAIVLFFSDFGLSQDLSNQVAVNYYNFLVRLAYLLLQLYCMLILRILIINSFLTLKDNLHFW